MNTHFPVPHKERPKLYGNHREFWQFRVQQSPVYISEGIWSLSKLYDELEKYPVCASFYNEYCKDPVPVLVMIIPSRRLSLYELYLLDLWSCLRWVTWRLVLKAWTFTSCSFEPCWYRRAFLVLTPVLFLVLIISVTIVRPGLLLYLWPLIVTLYLWPFLFLDLYFDQFCFSHHNHGFKAFDLFAFDLDLYLACFKPIISVLTQDCTDLFATTCLAFNLTLIKRKKILDYREFGWYIDKHLGICRFQCYLIYTLSWI